MIAAQLLELFKAPSNPQPPFPTLLTSATATQMCAITPALRCPHPPPHSPVLTRSKPTSSTSATVRWNCSSVSPGKPTMASPLTEASGM